MPRMFALVKKYAREKDGSLIGDRVWGFSPSQKGLAGRSEA